MPNDAFDIQAFYSALDSHRLAKGLTWKEVSEQAGVSQPTLSRMSQGRRPDVDGLALLLAWSGLDMAAFLPGQSEPETLAQVTALFRADQNLSPESKDALEDIVRVAYGRFRDR